MATEYLLDVDPVARAWNTIEFDGDNFIIRRYWESSDVDEILRANAEQRLDGAKPDPDIQHVARIPDIVQYEWLHKLGVNILDQNHQKRVKELLNSNEFYKLRVGGGRL